MHHGWCRQSPPPEIIAASPTGRSHRPSPGRKEIQCNNKDQLERLPSGFVLTCRESWRWRRHRENRERETNIEFLRWTRSSDHWHRPFYGRNVHLGDTHRWKAARGNKNFEANEYRLPLYDWMVCMTTMTCWAAADASSFCTVV